MRSILLLSDTHSSLDSKIFKYAESSDEIWHAGDIGNVEICKKLEQIKPVRAVYGNIDGNDIRKIYPAVQRFFCEEVDVLMTHIGGSPGKYSAEAKKLIALRPPKLFICGHSHILKVMYDQKYKLLYMNPGAAGNEGFHKVKTLLRFKIEKSNIKNLEVIEVAYR